MMMMIMNVRGEVVPMGGATIVVRYIHLIAIVLFITRLRTAGQHGHWRPECPYR